jgi:hypothetical protein
VGLIKLTTLWLVAALAVAGILVVAAAQVVLGLGLVCQ